MSWWLVLLFLNPSTDKYEVADGWNPLPQPSFTTCLTRMEYVQQYLPDRADNKFIVDCIESISMEDAIAQAKE